MPQQPPIPVAVVDQPVAVELTPDAVEALASTPRPTPGVQQQRTDPSVPARTTFQEDLVVAGQRRVNIIWETTQAAITILITIAAIYCAVFGIDADVLNFAFVAVISTYYARTNHTKIGGVIQGQAGR